MRDHILFGLLSVLLALNYLLQGFYDRLDNLSHYLRRCISKAFLKSCTHSFVVRKQGVRFRLNPKEGIANEIMAFGWENERVLPLLRKELKEGSVFVDLGANLGWFSLICGNLCGASGKVLSVEASPVTFERLQDNLSLNHLPAVTLVQAGVSDVRASLPFHFHRENPGASSFIHANDAKEVLIVECYPLQEILQQNAIDHIDVLKVDIEGFEYRVLSRFLQDADTALWPGMIFFEHHAINVEEEGGNIITLLLSHGYTMKYSFDHNFCMQRLSE